MSKQEADKLADALDNVVHLSTKSRDWCKEAAALLRQWPDGNVATYQYLFDGPYGEVWRNSGDQWNGVGPKDSRPLYTAPPAKPDGEPVAWIDSLTRPQPHCVTDLKYCSAAQHERSEHLTYVPLYTAPPDAASRIAELEKERDDFHMQYRVKCDEETKTQAVRIAELRATLKVAGEALEEMQYARTDKAERLTEEALQQIKEVQRG